MDERGAGWVLFAGIVLIWGGIMKIFDANWAFRYHGVLPSNLEAGIFGHSLKTYAWVDLGVAAILLICGDLVIKGSALPPDGWASSLPSSLESAPSGGCRSTRSGRSSTS